MELAVDFTLTGKSIQSESLGFDHRLHHPWQYRLFFNQSQVIRLGECVIFRIPNDHGHFRLGITLKARGTSVERNRVKRAIRENMRRLSPILGNYDYNVVVPAKKKMPFTYAKKLGRCLRLDLPRALA